MSQKHISSNLKLEISNQRILKFYHNNSHISFEAVNLLFLDLFEKIIYETNETLSSKMQSQLMIAINDTTNDISELKGTMASLKDSINSLHNDIMSNLVSKFFDIKTEYLNDLRVIIKNNTHEEIGLLLEKNNNLLIDKTSIIVNEIIPKNNKHHYSQINDL
jgi:hypothetical protein